MGNQKGKFNDEFRIASSRMQSWDYSKNAAYHVTICTQNKIHLFGNVVDEKMNLNETGFLAEKYWCEIPEHFSFVKLDEFVIMPNHVHGIIIIDKPNRDKAVPCLYGNDRFQNQGKESLSSIVGSFKSIVTKYARKIDLQFAWQPRFYEHIIRDRQDYLNTIDYIRDNPKKWQEDEYNE